MAITMHSASAPIFLKMLGNMLTWLDKAEAHATARKFDAANYLGLRLAPDMLHATSSGGLRFRQGHDGAAGRP
jgi:uncharacterized protein